MGGEWNFIEGGLLFSDYLYIFQIAKLPGLCGNTSYLTVAFSFLGTEL